MKDQPAYSSFLFATNNTEPTSFQCYLSFAHEGHYLKSLALSNDFTVHLWRSKSFLPEPLSFLLALLLFLYYFYSIWCDIYESVFKTAIHLSPPFKAASSVFLSILTSISIFFHSLGNSCLYFLKWKKKTHNIVDFFSTFFRKKIPLAETHIFWEQKI